MAAFDKMLCRYFYASIDASLGVCAAVITAVEKNSMTSSWVLSSWMLLGVPGTCGPGRHLIPLVYTLLYLACKKRALRAPGGSARYARSRGMMKRNRWSKQFGANRRIANAESSMLHPRKQPERRVYVRTYVHTWYFFSPFDMYTKEQAQHGENNQDNENENFRMKK